MHKGRQNSLFSEEQLKKCEVVIGYRFDNLSFLEKALTHASTSKESCMSNERLEFLGDSVLGLVISEFLFLTFRDFDEGDLSLIKSEVVSRATLARIAFCMGLHKYFSFNGSTEDEGLPNSVLANLFEAVVGSIYLDGGYVPARHFILKALYDEIDAVIKNPYQKNYKSLLQFIAQKYLSVTPIYHQMFGAKEKGPSSLFVTCAVLEKRRFMAGEGKNKKESEQAAAYHALQLLALEDPMIAEAVNPVLYPGPQKEIDIPSLFRDSKSLLLYVTNKFMLPPPVYEKGKLSFCKGKKMFFIHVRIGGRAFPEACSSKHKEAERMAAHSVLHFLAEEYSMKSPSPVPSGLDFSSGIDVPPFWSRNEWME